MTSQPFGKIDEGVDRHFFEKIVVTDTTFPDGKPQVLLRFKSAKMWISLINEGGQPIEYSFNGNNLHGELATSGPSQERTFEGKQVTKIWFRAASSSTVRVEIWGE